MALSVLYDDINRTTKLQRSTVYYQFIVQAEKIILAAKGIVGTA